MQLSVKDAAAFLNVDDKAIYSLIKQDNLPVHMINEQFRFNRSELLEWATEHQRQVNPDLFTDLDAGDSTLIALSEALRDGGIAYHIHGSDQASVLRSVVDVLKLDDDIDRDFLYDVILARETLGSTGIGDGIAIPHVRNPVVLHVSRPSVTLCFLEEPIDFNAIDGEPVDILFTLICPTVKAHLHILSRLGFALHNEAFREALQRRAPEAEIMAVLTAAEAALPADKKA